VRADAGALTPDEQRELNTWLEADPRHRGAYVRARAHWVDLDRLAALHGPAPANLGTSADLKSAPRSDPASVFSSAPTPTPPPPAVAFPTLSRRHVLAASIAAITVVGGGFSWIVLRGGRERYMSDIGEVRRIALADGSTMLLNTNTEVAVNLTPQQRDIQLVRGEALFEVAHDEARPFIVRANGTSVRAVGTAFAVRLEAAQVDVTVTEGVVEVASTAAADPFAASTSASIVQRVSANERLVVTHTHAAPIRPIAPTEADRQLAWREGMVSFDGESLATAVAEINRHNRRQIVIDDPALADKPVVGIFRATDLDGFSAAAAEALKARAVSEGDVILLESVAEPRH